MTEERQDVMTDFYAGNNKRLVVTCRNADGSAKNITGAEITYTMFSDDEERLLVKSSSKGSDEIELTVPASGICIVNFH